MLCGKLRLPITFLSLTIDSSFLNSLSDFCLLQVACASCKLSSELGCPCLEIGMIWSTTGAIGFGGFNVTSTGYPQIPQVFCVFNIRFRFRSYAARWVPVLSKRIGWVSFLVGGCQMNIGWVLKKATG